jgi:hypothetical protein
MTYNNYNDYIKTNDYKLVKHDLTIWLTIVIISNLVHYKIKNKDPFDMDWVLYSFASLFGLVMHSLFTSKITIYIIKKYNIKSYNVRESITDVIKWTTVYILNNIIVSYFKNKEINFNDKWIKMHSGVIVGYIIFNLLIEKNIFNVSMTSDPDLIISIFKSIIGIFLGYFITDGYVHLDCFHMITSVVLALIVYYVIVKKFIRPILL